MIGDNTLHRVGNIEESLNVEEQKEKDRRKMEDQFHQNPFFSEMPRFMELARRNLIIISLTVLLSVKYGFETIKAGEFKIWKDVVFNQNTDINVQTILFWLLTYHIFHFLSHSIIYLKKNRIRLTGTKVSIKTDNRGHYGGGVNDACDYPSDSSQATLIMVVVKKP